MDEEKHLNIRKIVLTLAIFIFAFIIILGSAVLTKQSRKSREKDNLTSKSIDKKNIMNVQTEYNNEEQVVQENTVVVSKQEEIKIENKTIESGFNNNVENTTKTSTSTKNKIVKSERLPVANPDAVALCKAAQTSDEKNIYLTFDDGPSPNVTPQILKILKDYDVPGTFFVLGSRVELYPELVRQEYEEGHYIANHGYTHNYSAIYSSVQSVIDEYNKADTAVQEALGNSNYHTLLFRFPGGSSGGPYNDLKQEAKRSLENMGIASTNWNCLNGDAEGGTRTKEQLINRLYETAARWNSLVVLMHDANDKQTTADALPEIIEHYKQEGYTFKNYYEIFQ